MSATFAAAWLLLVSAGADARVPAPPSSALTVRELVFEQGGVRVEVHEEVTRWTERAAGSHDLEVRITAGGRTVSWRSELGLDGEKTGWPAVEFHPATGRPELALVRMYSGGAHCCWFMAAFDVRTLTPLKSEIEFTTPAPGAVLWSESAIELVRNRRGCAFGAWVDPDAVRPPELRCLVGRRFVKKKGARYPETDPAAQ